MIGAQALLCIALNVYHESRSEPLKGQIAVAQVTMNRARQQEKHPCKVVFARSQFSWTAGALHRGQIRARFIPDRTDPSWAKAQRVARQVARGAFPDVTRGAIFYHERSVRPYWTRRMVRVARIGAHIFYRKA